ncbi:MAG: PKD domain-containing protein, partial [Bacteroidia bacterium]|nr:PKD domain-containing protein [Bacteroidia bacterium]
FGDQSSSQELNPVHIYSSPGSYNVTLSVYSPAGCVDEISRVIEVYNPPSAAFEVQALGTCMTDAFRFSDVSTSTPPISAWLWDMGDGTTYNTPNVEHRYTSGGEYTVRLIVENEDGCRDTAEQIVHVPGFDFVATNACVGNATQFSAESFYPQGVAIKAYTWEIFDSPPTIYNTENPVHIFDEEGNYDVKLTMRTNSGCTDTIRKTIFVARPPVAEFSILNNPVTGTPVYFVNQSNAFGAQVIRWSWDFGAPGGADTASTFNAEFAYSLPGNYNVVLTMETAAGCRDTFTQTIKICDSEFCNLPTYFLPDTLCSQKQLNFIAAGQCVRQAQWNYCSVATAEPDSPIEFPTIVLNTPRGMELAKDGENWYGFVCPIGPGLQRLDFGNSLFNEPTVVNLSGVPSMGSPRGPEILRYRGKWYAFVVNDGPIFYRVDFGPSL